MKMFLTYLKAKLPAVLFVIFLLAAAVMILVLCGADISGFALAYCGVLCAFAGAVYMLFDFLRYRRLCEKLRCLLEEPVIAEADLPEAADDIQKGYEELIRRFIYGNTELRNSADRRIADMTDYYTMWAHQIKTPIAAMQLILQTEEHSDSGELSENLRSIERYVEMVMCYIRLESDSSDYLIGKYDADKIIRGEVKKFSPQFIRKRLKLDYEPLNMQIVTDEKWFAFVIGQILSNSLKYTRSGSVSVYSENGSCICIADTGAGIAPEDLPRIFEKGYTGCNGREYQKASGLGLYLCKTVCKRLGHDIAAFSDENGTIVKIYVEAYNYIPE